MGEGEAEAEAEKNVLLTEIVGFLPSVPDLEIVVLYDELQEGFE